MLSLSKEYELKGNVQLKSLRNTVDINIENDIDRAFFLKISNGTFDMRYQLCKTNDNVYSCMIQYTEEYQDERASFKASVIITNGTESFESSRVDVLINRTKIISDIKTYSTVEMINIKKQICELELRLKTLTSGRLLTSIPSFDKTNIKKGMILTAVSDDGHFAFVYPFADILNEVNGKHSIMRSIVLDASDIKLKDEDVTTDAIIKAIRENQISESKIIKDILSSLSTLTTKVAKLESTLVDFTNNQ